MIPWAYGEWDDWLNAKLGSVFGSGPQWAFMYDTVKKSVDEQRGGTETIIRSQDGYHADENQPTFDDIRAVVKLFGLTGVDCSKKTQDADKYSLLLSRANGKPIDVNCSITPDGKYRINHCNFDGVDVPNSASYSL